MSKKESKAGENAQKSAPEKGAPVTLEAQPQTGAGVAGALAAREDEKDLPPLPRRLAWASVGAARAATVMAITEVVVRKEMFMGCPKSGVGERKRRKQRKREAGRVQSKISLSQDLGLRLP